VSAVPESHPIPNLFSLQGVSVAYDGEAVLKDIYLEIREGEQVVIFGPSGAGKTTLLRRLLELRPDRTAFIHQDYALVPQLSVFHNVYAGSLDQNSWHHNLRNLVRPHTLDVEKVEAVIARVGLEGKLWDSVSDLSGGQQQRVAVARAIFRGVNVLLADEPVASVDSQQSAAILQMLKNVAETSVVSLHDVSLGMDVFSRVIGVRAGQIEFDLPTADVSPVLLENLYRPC
jgi:phosphonate transport system ATP-binding protein